MTWPLTARLTPDFIEALRLPLAVVTLTLVLLLDVPFLMLTLYHRWRWWQEGTLALRLPQERKRRTLSRSICDLAFRVFAAVLLLRFSTVEIAARADLQGLIVLVSVAYLFCETIPMLRMASKFRKP